MKSKDITGMTNNVASLHPFVLYNCEENQSDLVSTSICFISDDLKHDVNFVYKVMKDAIKYIRITLQKLFLKCIIFQRDVLVST